MQPSPVTDQLCINNPLSRQVAMYHTFFVYTKWRCVITCGNNAYALMNKANITSDKNGKDKLKWNIILKMPVYM